MKNKQGQYLKDVAISFLLDTRITKKDAEEFLRRLVTHIKVHMTSLIINDLPPGFDIYVGIKESFIYFGYWGEYVFVRMNVCSCKNFEENKIVKLVRNHFKLRSPIIVEINKDHSIEEEIKYLKCPKKSKEI